VQTTPVSREFWLGGRPCPSAPARLEGVLERATRRRDATVIAALTDAVARYPRWGFWKLFDRLRVEQKPWNHKRVHRVYCALRLNLPRRRAGYHAVCGNRWWRRRS